MTEALPLIWAGIIGAAVALYVLFDGFDLGVGILFPFAHSERERDQMMTSVAPLWDGNETWLVLGGGALWIAFPLAYAVVMPAVYLPLIVMLLALVFRGVAFEFRVLAGERAAVWSIAFSGGSAIAAFFQGVILATLISGIKVEHGAFAGAAFDWATLFAALCGFGVVAGYALLGATWLIMKTEGKVAERARRQAKALLVAVLALMGAVSVWTPLADARIAERWFSMPNLALLSPIPIATAAVAFALWRAVQAGREAVPFFCAMGLFLLGYLGLAISSYPYLVPPALTIADAAAPPSTQAFMLVGTLPLLPVILGYAALVYWIFRGKVREGEGYH